MSYLYVAFDVETPNRMNDRISSIGITTVDEKGILCTDNFLVNPECDFDGFNISLTGITPAMVEKAPTFPAIWGRFEPVFTNNILVAHNANFDLSVLQKTLAAYKLTMPKIRYICTLKMAQRCLSCVDNYKLPTLCSHFQISLNHHNAGSDSKACALILLNLIKEGNNPDAYVLNYDSDNSLPYGKRPDINKRTLSETTQALNELNGILKAVSCDGTLTREEISYLIGWMNNNSSLNGNYPYDRIYKKLAEVIEDGIITNQEQAELMDLFQTASNPLAFSVCLCSLLELEGKNICLSGEFNYGSKDSISTILCNKGAVVQKSVTRKPNFLVVGNQGSAAWCSGNYGSKIKKALELKEKGVNIQIMREVDFFNAIEV